MKWCSCINDDFSIVFLGAIVVTGNCCYTLETCFDGLGEIMLGQGCRERQYNLHSIQFGGVSLVLWYPNSENTRMKPLTVCQVTFVLHCLESRDIPCFQIAPEMETVVGHTVICFQDPHIVFLLRPLRALF